MIMLISSLVSPIEEADRRQLTDTLKKAKAAGLQTVVILNIAVPVDMKTWIDGADAILCLFIPGCMGNKAAADLSFGQASPAKKKRSTCIWSEMTCIATMPKNKNGCFQSASIA